MIYPNKNIRFEESIIFKMVSILDRGDYTDIKIKDLYKEIHMKFQNADEFIYSLDVLFILDMIEVDFENETIKYAKRN